MTIPLGMIASGIGTLYNVATSGKRAAEQRAQNEEERRKQIEGSKELTDYNSKKQEELYRRTTAPLAMLEQYKEANLSPGLMYGGSGSGGSIPTINTQTPSRGAVPDANAARGNDINQMMGLAQLGLIQAQTEKTKAEAEKVQGADTENTIQQTAESKARQAFAEINTKYESQAIDWKLDKIAQESNIALGEAQSALAKGGIDSEYEVVGARISQIKQEALNAAIQATAMESGMRLNEAKINEIGQDIARKWAELNTAQTKNRYEHDDRIKAIEEYTANALKVAGIHAVTGVVRDVVGIATKTGRKGTVTTTTNGNGDTWRESWTRPIGN